jgi:hypothetical protein
LSNKQNIEQQAKIEHTVSALIEQQVNIAAMARIADMPAAPTAWATEHVTAPHAELRSCNAECTAKKPRWAVLPHDSELCSSAVAGAAEAGAATSASENVFTAPTVPNAAGQRTSTSVPRPPRPRRQLPAATKAPADLTPLDDLTAATLTLPPTVSTTSTTSWTAANCNWASWDERRPANTGNVQNELRCSEPIPQLARGGIAAMSPIAAMSVLARFAAAIDTEVPGYTPSLIFPTYGR